MDRWNVWVYHSLSKHMLSTGARYSSGVTKDTGIVDATLVSESRCVSKRPQQSCVCKEGQSVASTVKVPQKSSQGVTLELHLRYLIMCGWFGVPGTEGT